MPINKNALIRYKVIDSCLRNRQRKWTLDMLVGKVSDALYEYDGITKGASIRTVQYDIQMMRSDKIGYNAPIVVIDKKYYTYEDPKYSITNLPISTTDMQQMSEAVALLKQFKGFEHFNKLSEVVQKLEDHVYSTSKNEQSIIHFEKNELLTGIHYLDQLYKAINQQEVLNITYQSFKAEVPNNLIFHPWWLKEYKNRWFLFGVKSDGKAIINLALDRIIAVKQELNIPYRTNTIISIEDYFKDIVGVTVSSIRPQTVVIQVDPQNAPYVITKPIHSSQEVLERLGDGSIIIKIRVQINFELEREILSFGDAMSVIIPHKFRSLMLYKAKKMIENYED